jgi:hypothetical protein
MGRGRRATRGSHGPARVVAWRGRTHVHVRAAAEAAAHVPDYLFLKKRRRKDDPP